MAPIFDHFLLHSNHKLSSAKPLKTNTTATLLTL